MTDRAAHWAAVYRAQQAGQVSWFRPHLDVSMELLELAGLTNESRVIDVGAGASTLVDDLLLRGVESIFAVDLAAAALQVARNRLSDGAGKVRWIVGDVTKLDLPASSVDIWHDRAALHFLTDPTDAAAYVRVAAGAIACGGYAVIGGFASDGPEQCSGLAVVRRDPSQIAELFAEHFTMIAARRETHITPRGSAHKFAYALLRRHAG